MSLLWCAVVLVYSALCLFALLPTFLGGSYAASLILLLLLHAWLVVTTVLDLTRRTLHVRWGKSNATVAVRVPWDASPGYYQQSFQRVMEPLLGTQVGESDGLLLPISMGGALIPVSLLCLHPRWLPPLTPSLTTAFSTGQLFRYLKKGGDKSTYSLHIRIPNTPLPPLLLEATLPALAMALRTGWPRRRGNGETCHGDSDSDGDNDGDGGENGERPKGGQIDGVQGLEPLLRRLESMDFLRYVGPPLSSGAYGEQNRAQLGRSVEEHMLGSLRTKGYALIKAPRLMAKIDVLYGMLRDFFRCADEEDRARYSKAEHDLESLCRGYFEEGGGRMFFEVRQTAQEDDYWPPIEGLRETALDVWQTMHDVCTCVYALVVRACPAVDYTAAMGILEGGPCGRRMVRVSSSCFRMHRYPKGRGGDDDGMGVGVGAGVKARGKAFAKKLLGVPHCDIGLLTMAPRGTVDGLRVCRQDQDCGAGADGAYEAVERSMGADEFLVFGGTALGVLTGGWIRPLIHCAVPVLGVKRMSMPFFFRASPSAPLPRAMDWCTNGGENYYGSGGDTYHSSAVDFPRASSAAHMPRAMNQAEEDSNEVCETYHQLMSRIRRDRHGSQIPIPFVREVYYALHAACVRYFPDLEYRVTPSGKI